MIKFNVPPFTGRELDHIKDAIIATATIISVIVIQEIDARDKLKFLITLLKASRILRPNILNSFIIICSFLFKIY